MADDERCGAPFEFFLRVTTICGRPKGHAGEHNPLAFAHDRAAVSAAGEETNK